jgi:hypothetical protein
VVTQVSTIIYKKVKKKKKKRPCTFPTGKAGAATSQRELRKSHWEIPLGAFRAASGTFKERLEKRVGARGELLVVGRVATRAARRPWPRRLPLAGASVGGAPLPCARHFLWGTSYSRRMKNYLLGRSWVIAGSSAPCFQGGGGT